MRINVLTSATLCTVQDLGRPGWQSSGVPPGGAADPLSHRLANLMLGNSEKEATIEVAGMGFSAKIERGGWLCLAGPSGAWALDLSPRTEKAFFEKTSFLSLTIGRPFFAPEAAILRQLSSGDSAYTYIGVKNGWDCPHVLGSRSTCLAASFGGFEGRALRRGDILQNLEPSGEMLAEERIAKPQSFWPPAPHNVIHVLPGPEIERWSAVKQARFFEEKFAVTAQSNRMGLRLRGTPLPCDTEAAMLSTAVFPGTIQVPPDGQPIVLLADAQTTGGYPRIGQVMAADLPKLAQMRPGQDIFFKRIELETAEKWLFRQENQLRCLALGIRLAGAPTKRAGMFTHSNRC